MSAEHTIRVGILGASGYTGADLVRLLATHPRAEIALLTAERKAGRKAAEVFPHFAVGDLPDLISVDDVDWDAAELDVVFCALPHGTTQVIVSKLYSDLKESTQIIDLSADFRLYDVSVYAEWYGKPHQAETLQPKAAYGLTEHNRKAVAGARLVACPGCYPTAALLALLPLLGAGAIEADDIIIDAKSGVSGAGRGLKEANLFTEVSEALHPYGLGSHRHMPEIEQELGKAAGRDVRISFTPHLVPMNRGELETIYVKTAAGGTAQDLKAVLVDRYADEPFIHVLADGVAPATRQVRGSNHCTLNVFEDRIAGRAIVVAAIDNLVKGSSGQAIQNMNLMRGLPETLGLEQMPLFP